MILLATTHPSGNLPAYNRGTGSVEGSASRRARRDLPLAASSVEKFTLPFEARADNSGLEKSNTKKEGGRKLPEA